MQKEEHHTEAAIHFEMAANFYKKAHDYHTIGEYEKSSFEVQKARAHHKRAKFHMDEADKLNAKISVTY
jgi:hypothetical protein